MSEIPLTTPRNELPPQGREGWDVLQETGVSPEDAKAIIEVTKRILSRAGDVGMKRVDFFSKPAFKGLTEEQISLVLAAEAAPIFEASGRVYWVGPSEIEDIKLTDV